MNRLLVVTTLVFTAFAVLVCGCARPIVPHDPTITPAIPALTDTKQPEPSYETPSLLASSKDMGVTDVTSEIRPYPEQPQSQGSSDLGSATPVNTPLGGIKSRKFSPKPTAFPEFFPLTVTGSNGDHVVLESAPLRIVAFDSAAVEILFAIGEGDRVIGTHDFVSYPPESENITKLGGAFNMDIEKTVALEPDLVYVFFDTFLPDLKRAGLKVLYIKTLDENFLKVADQIRMWGQITESAAVAEIVASDFETRVRRIDEKMANYSPASSIFQDVGDFWTPGSDTLVHEVFDLLKLKNIAHDITGYGQLSPEIIVERNPEYIITTYDDAFTGEPAFAEILAVKNNGLYTPSVDYLSTAGPRFVDGIEELASKIYPELFE